MGEAFYFRRHPAFSLHVPVFHCINLDVLPFAGWPLYAAAAVWRSAAAASGDMHAYKLLVPCIFEIGRASCYYSSK